MSADRSKSTQAGRGAAPAAGRRCDLCGKEVASVRRVALDREYDRLQLTHRELYACDPCFETKEQKRLGLNRR